MSIIGKYFTDMHCDTKPLNIGWLYVQKNALDENPPYQRESAIWSPQKKELFIDSIVNGYDIPKIYFHDLRSRKENKHFAIIDGKQRLDTLWAFLDSKFPLASDFKLNQTTYFQNVTSGLYFKDFSTIDQEAFRNISLDIVMVQDATEEDIEDLFFRLNNGEPLNAAEKRNAKGGEMNKLIKEVSGNDFFVKKISFDNKRFAHFEISAKILLLEKTEMDSKEMFSDLKKKFLDKIVIDNKSMTTASKDGLLKRVVKQLSVLNNVFADKDPLLAKQAYPPLYYLFVKTIHKEYGHSHLNSILKSFLENFQIKRQQNLEVDEDNADPVISEFSRLMQQGTNDINSLKSRVSILRRFFLQENPDVKILDSKRQFTFEERHTIWLLSSKQCVECQKALPELKDMEADHELQWAFGGETTLKNARALCSECNERLKKTKK